MVALRPAVVVALVALGVFFLSVGTIGLLRFPNVYNRMHATSKPTTLGTAAIFLASFVAFGPGGAGLPSLIGVVFLFLTAPTGAHMISRSAQRIGIPFLGGVTWPGKEDEEGLESWTTDDSDDEEDVDGENVGDGKDVSDGEEAGDER